MGRKRFSPEQIITLLREAEVLLNQSIPVAEVCRKLQVSEQTYYRWRKGYGGMRVDQAKRLKELEQENARLKKLVADLSLDNAILKVTCPPFLAHSVSNFLNSAKCGKEINGSKSFFPYCGQDLSQYFCPGCQYPVKPDWEYCPSCRAVINPREERKEKKKL
jgi:putative transposase